ncbi:membrane protein [Levilactobacillus zymae]|uniref:Membrane protein n=1 Tax=Levilactobacillus zymae TaxID=267363 RepID=A0ABQ0X2P2_9LACO|nr:YhgE/Pip domain-containing protein [Levilactobacillus zymae]KRL16335.1 integral membrane protein [Levilactobacillus zymae DSM 19395]QFR61927.1 DUF3533 domain-containing protein [Levilactobacillus zymae]GEO72612.1 membrane protein [Levilactobacillus zymae]
MFKAEWGYLRQHKFMVIVLCVIMFIPSIYAVTFLKSMWDPYGKTGDLPVAVVNQDQPVTYQGKHLSVGRNLTQNLKDSKALDFEAMPASQAHARLKQGKVYMVLTIPQNFSQNATTLLDQKPQAMNLHYDTSAGQSFIASKMSESAMSTIRANVANQVTKLYAKTMFGAIKQLDTGMGTAAKGNQKLATGSRKLKAANQKIATNLNTLASSSLKLQSGSQTLTTGLNKYIAGVDELQAGNQKVVSGLDQLLAKSNQLVSGVTRLSQGAQSLNGGVTSYVAGAQQVNTGATKVNRGAQQVASGTQQFGQGTAKLASGTTQFGQGLTTYVNGVGSVNSGATKLNQGVAQLQSKTGTLNESTTKLATGATSLNSGLKTLSTNSATLTSNLQALQKQLSQSTTSTAAATKAIAAAKQQAGANGMTGVKTALGQLETAVKASGSLHQDVAATADAQKLTGAQKAAVLATVDKSANTTAITTALGSLSSAISDATATTTDTAATKALAAAGSQQDQLAATVGKLASGSQALTGGLQTAATSSDQLATGLTQVNAALPGLTTGVDQLASGARSLAGGTAKLTTSGQQLTSGFQTVNTGAAALNQKSQQLASGANQVASGTQKLTTGTGQLSQKGAQLTSGAGQVASGLQQMQTQLPSLTSGVSQLANGSQQVATGLGRLATNGSQLTSGANQLATGTGQAAAGAKQLASGAGQAAQAGGQVQAGNQQLATKLGSAAAKGQLNPSKLTYAQVAKPVTTTHTDKDDVPNNGTGMAPYMMCVSLFVGALALNMMFDLYTPHRFPKSGIQWWASKASIWGLFVLLETGIMFTLMMVIDGLRPIHPFATLIVLLLAAATFMTIVAWLNLVFGKAGSFFSMVLLVLQLGASAGTYPIQLSNHFFETIHPWLPMSYSVEGLRQTLMTGNTAWPEIGMLFGFLLFFTGCTWLFYLRRYARLKRIDFSDPLAVQATQNGLARRMARQKQ